MSTRGDILINSSIVVHDQGVLYLIKDINAASSKLTPLHLAAANGHVETIKELLDKKEIDINVAASHGCTPLHLAVINGHVEVIKELLDKGAEVNATTDSRYIDIAVSGCTPLHLAVINGHVEAVKELLDKGAEVNAVTDHGCTPLHFAAMDNHVEVIKELLDRGAEVNAIDFNKCTPLHFAVALSKEEAVETLIKHGAEAGDIVQLSLLEKFSEYLVDVITKPFVWLFGSNKENIDESVLQSDTNILSEDNSGNHYNAINTDE